MIEVVEARGVEVFPIIEKRSWRTALCAQDAWYKFEGSPNGDWD
jgi:hypothetical protein